MFRNILHCAKQKDGKTRLAKILTETAFRNDSIHAIQLYLVKNFKAKLFHIPNEL